MSDTHITINGGTNTIAPNATKIEQHFYGTQPDEESYNEEGDDAQEDLSDAGGLLRYISKEDIPGYLAMIGECHTATELADVVMTMMERLPRLKAEEVVKARFINILFPLATKLTCGTSVSNVRQHINNALARRPKR